MEYISQFYVMEMWGRIDVSWKHVYEDVNIIVGINGCGKTTLLNLIYDFYTGTKPKKNVAKAIEGSSLSSPITYIRSFDVPANGKKKTESLLLQELKNIINQNGEGTSFFDYRMKMLNYPDQVLVIQKRIDKFFKLIDRMFIDTGKRIGIDPKNNTLSFYPANRELLEGEPDDRLYPVVSLDQLSSGEKQLLLILTTVFLQEEKPNVLLMDEPEISLHIGWQDQLISILRELNPKCQLILTTHSPNIFANGWEDRIVFMEDLEN